jgi:hypothetical protein
LGLLFINTKKFKMAVVLNFEIEQTDNAKILIFRETTGAYDALLNTDGWGAPNDDTSGTTPTLTITAPGGTEKVYTASEITGLGSFPTTDANLELELTLENLNIEADSNGHLPDGVWTIRYDVEKGLNKYTVFHKVFVSGSVRCCVYKGLASIDLVDCDCDSKEKAYALQAFTFYMSLIANAACGNQDKYDELLKITNKLCGLCKC